MTDSKVDLKELTLQFEKKNNPVAFEYEPIDRVIILLLDCGHDIAVPVSSCTAPRLENRF